MSDHVRSTPNSTQHTATTHMTHTHTQILNTVACRISFFLNKHLWRTPVLRRLVDFRSSSTFSVGVWMTWVHRFNMSLACCLDDIILVRDLLQSRLAEANASKGGLQTFYANGSWSNLRLARTPWVWQKEHVFKTLVPKVDPQLAHELS